MISRRILTVRKLWTARSQRPPSFRNPTPRAYGRVYTHPWLLPPVLSCKAHLSRVVAFVRRALPHVFFLTAGLSASLLAFHRGRVGLCAQERREEELVVAQSSALIDASPRCQRFVAWLLHHGIDVVVFDMDQTMGGGHCGPGLPRNKLDDYVGKASPDFVEAAKVLCKIPGMKLAVATMSDPSEYDLQGQSRQTHILGPDLARALIERHCPEALPHFEIMVGFDPELHPDVPKQPGKSVQMQQIAKHYNVPYSRMVLLDDSKRCLKNVDGWLGILVQRYKVGFRFEDCFDNMPYSGAGSAL